MSKVTIKFWWGDRGIYLSVYQNLKVNPDGVVERVENGIVMPQTHIEAHYYKDGERIA